MKLLAIDTSSNACSVALLIDGQITSIHEITPMQQAQKILSIIEHLLKESFIELNQLDAIAFGCGPGSFTGVRIATGIAQGIGYAANIPLIPISSLAALAQATYADLGWQNLLVGIDARVKEVYWGMYQVDKSGLVELIGKELVCPPEEVSLPENIGWYGVGNAWEVYRSQITYNPLELDVSRLPMATGILQLAIPKYQSREWVSAENASPCYLRDNVAKKS